MQFEINAITKVFYETNDKSLSLIGKDKFIIPIYQRPYSWKEKEVNRLLQGIVEAYNKKEPYFMGTIQLKGEEKGQVIIDGQQRITTLLLLFKALTLKEIDVPVKLKSNGLIKSNVSNQTLLLQSVLALNTFSETIINQSLNKFFQNLMVIKNYLEEVFENIPVNLPKYLCSQLYFVVIETKKDISLTKILDIFNTINTAGMDLNTGDLFKIQFFDYLQKYQPLFLGNDSNLVFQQINELYEDIDKRNQELGWKAVKFKNILESYKYILVARNKANRSLYQLRYSTFFERLFAVLLKNGKYSEFNKLKENAPNLLVLEELKLLVDIQFSWHNKVDEKLKHLHTSELHPFFHLFWWYSRFGRYSILTDVYLFTFLDEVLENKQQFTQFCYLYLKYYFIQSIRYQRIASSNEGHRFTYNLLSLFFKENTSQELVIQKLKDEIKKFKPNFQEWYLERDVFYIKKKKELLFWLLAILHEEKISANIVGKYFNYGGGTDYDVEHIQAKEAQSTKKNREDWKPYLNTIGNLVLLERKINRSIKEKEFKEKTKAYIKSDLPIIEKLRNDNQDGNWTTEKVIERGKVQKELVMEFLFKN